MNKPLANTGEIYSLTSFRFIVALMVFLFHCRIHFDFHVGIHKIDNIIMNSATFMSGFFVLSGYIMCHVYQHRDFNQPNEVWNFYIKRFARIYPVYLVSTVVYFIFVNPSTPYTVMQWLRIVINDVFVTQAFFPNMFGLGINGGTWSISVEAFFYLMFPLAGVVCFTRPKLLLWSSIVITAVINANLLLTICDGGSLGTYANPMMRMNEFMLGAAFCLLASQGKLENIPRVFRSGSFLFALILLGTFLKQSRLEFSYMGLHMVLLPIFALFILSCHRLNSGFMCSNPALLYLGKVSYSFYMWQFIAIKLGVYIFLEYGIDTRLIMLAMLSLNILLASLSYHMIENPFRAFIVDKFRRPAIRKRPITSSPPLNKSLEIS